MTLGSKIIKNTGVQLIGRGISTILGVLAVALLARYLGTSGYGEYTIATSFLQFFAIVVDFGLTLTTLTMISEVDGTEDGAEERLVANLTTLRIVSSIIFFALAPLLVIFFPYSSDVKTSVAVGAVAYAILSVNQMLVGVFQKYLAMHLAALAEVAGRAALLGAMAYVAWSGGTVVDMVTAMIVANLCQLLFLLLYARRFVAMKLAYDFKVWRKIIARSWPIGVSTILNLVYLKGDIIILSLFRSASEVGLYGAAYKVLDVLTVIPMMFMGLVLPPLTAAWKRADTERVRYFLQRSFDAMFLLGLPLLVGGALVAEPMMRLIGGPEFQVGSSYLSILLIALFAVFLSGLFGHAVVAIGKQRPMIWGYFADAAISLVAYFIFVPIYGATAAAWITVLSEAIIALLTYLMVRRVTQFKPTFRVALKVVLACLLMSGVILVSLNLPVLITVSLGALVYFAVIYLSGAIPKELLSGLISKSV